MKIRGFPWQNMKRFLIARYKKKKQSLIRGSKAVENPELSAIVYMLCQGQDSDWERVGP